MIFRNHNDEDNFSGIIKTPQLKRSFSTQPEILYLKKTMAGLTLFINDSSASGKIIRQIPVEFSGELITVREIIRSRVLAEVDMYNKDMPEYYTGLVQPTDAEATLNGYRLKQRKMVNAEEQCRVAIDAFSKNGYFILIDNIQAESLDQMIVINKNTDVSFVKLTPLIGG